MTQTSSSPYSTLPTRVMVALVAIPLILWAAFQGGYWFFALVALISGFSLWEFYLLAERKGVAPLKLIGLIFGLLVNFAFVYERAQIDLYRFFEGMGIRLSMFSQLQLLLVLELVFVVLVLLVELFRHKGSPLLNIGTTVLGVVTISLFFGTLIAIRELFPYGFPVYKFFPSALAQEQSLEQINRWGGFTIAAILATVWICDTAAYFGGLSLGKHKLFERVSPKKTWEGAVFGFVFANITMLVVQMLFLEYLSYSDALVIGSIIGVFGQVGDLIESRFKRDVEVKDSSAIIPGHGGVYDRFDSLVFVAPILYLYIDFVVLS
ncbi:MAG TPA: phosphatidate cytidylyltransferase [Bacteroidota bacterium]|nr:phosphatidate cytidylyltransferase [Bacteroidota bacterium]